MRATTVVTLLSLAFTITQSARAYDVTFNFTGVATNVTGSGPSLLAPQVGDVINFSLHYNLSFPDLNPDPSVGIYKMGANCAILDATLHGTQMSSLAYEDFIAITNSSSDHFFAECELDSDGYLGITLNDSTGTALSSDALPTSWTLTDWDGGSFSLTTSSKYSLGQGLWSVSGVIPVPEPSFVPEPGIMTLSGISAVALMMFRRSKSYCCKIR